MNENRITVSKDTLAVLGNGKVGYIRKMTSDEVTERFPDAPQIQSGNRPVGAVRRRRHDHPVQRRQVHGLKIYFKIPEHFCLPGDETRRPSNCCEQPPGV